jgi:hypothetical protein
MSALSTIAALALLAPRPTVQSVVLERDAARPTLTITASEPLPAPETDRQGERLTLTWEAELAPGAMAPLPQPPLRAIRLLPRDGRLALELTIDPAVPHAIEVEGARVRLAFGAPPPPPPDLTALWATLFPALSVPEPMEAPPAAADTSGPAAESEDGLSVGRVRLRPALEAVWVSAESTFESPEPVHDEYFELRPRLAAQAGLGAGAFTADYEARWRRGSTFDDVEETSHLLNGGLELPVGTRLTLRVSDHFAVGTLETREVDPGGEYFFGLGRFRRNRFGVQARLATAGRVRVEAGAFWDALEVDDDAAFFDYERRTVEGRLDYELGPRLTAAAALAFERIPTPSERPLAQSSAYAVGLELKGELDPLTLAEVSLGLRDQDTPRAAPAGREFRGLVLGARVRRLLGPEAALQVAASRATFPSAFEANAFYVASAVGAELDLPVPASLLLRLAAGYHWNDYRTRAVGLAEPRRDRIWVGAVGLSRPLTRLAWVRADYRRERRDSNLDSFDVRTYVFAVQVGFGFLGSPGR